MADMKKILKYLSRTRPDTGRTTPVCPPAEAGKEADGHGQGYIPCPIVRPPAGSLKFSIPEGCNMNAAGTAHPSSLPGLLPLLRWTRP